MRMRRSARGIRSTSTFAAARDRAETPRRKRRPRTPSADSPDHDLLATHPPALNVLPPSLGTGHGLELLCSGLLDLGNPARAQERCRFDKEQPRLDRQTAGRQEVRRRVPLLSLSTLRARPSRADFSLALICLQTSSFSLETSSRGSAACRSTPARTSVLPPAPSSCLVPRRHELLLNRCFALHSPFRLPLPRLCALRHSCRSASAGTTPSLR